MNYSRIITLLEEAEYMAKDDKKLHKAIEEVIGLTVSQKHRVKILPERPSEVLLTYSTKTSSPYVLAFLYKGEDFSELKKKYYETLEDAIGAFETFPEGMRQVDEYTFRELGRRKDLNWMKEREEEMFKEWLKVRKRKNEEIS